MTMTIGLILAGLFALVFWWLLRLQARIDTHRDFIIKLSQVLEIAIRDPENSRAALKIYDQMFSKKSV